MFSRGEIVECVDDSGVRPLLRRGRFYSVIGTVSRPWGQFVVLADTVECRHAGFYETRFRRPRTDISVFKAMLEAVPAEVSA